MGITNANIIIEPVSSVSIVIGLRAGLPSSCGPIIIAEIEFVCLLSEESAPSVGHTWQTFQG